MLQIGMIVKQSKPWLCLYQTKEKKGRGVKIDALHTNRTLMNCVLSEESPRFQRRRVGAKDNIITTR